LAAQTRCWEPFEDGNPTCRDELDQPEGEAGTGYTGAGYEDVKGGRRHVGKKGMKAESCEKENSK
jgi:hypothetical protein